MIIKRIEVNNKMLARHLEEKSNSNQLVIDGVMNETNYKKVVAFNKENPSDLFSQLVKVLVREKDRGKMDRLIKDLKGLSSQIFSEIKKPILAHTDEDEK